MGCFGKRMILAAAAFGFVVGASAIGARAEEAKSDKPAAVKSEGTGTIAGKVVGKDGKAVAGARVALVKAPDREQRRERKAARQNGEGKAEGTTAEKPKRPEPVATTKTDDEGKFTFKDVAAGNYSLRAQLRGQGTATTRVTVAAGETADAAVTLKQGPGGGSKGARDKGDLTPEEQAEREQRRQERKAAKKAAKNQI